MPNPWFRLHSEFAKDPKVQSMSESFQRRLIMLFCLKCSEEYDSLTDEEIAFALHLDVETLHETFQVFQEKGFLDKNNQILNWDKRQYKSDSSTDRVKEHRRKKKENQEVDETKQDCNVTVTPSESDTDTDTESKDSIYSAFELYNSQAEKYGLPKAVKLTQARKAKIKARIKQFGLDSWNEVMYMIDKSEFLQGKNNKGWRPDLDFFLQEKSFTRALEGFYLKGKAHGTREQRVNEAADQAIKDILENQNGSRPESTALPNYSKL